MEPRKDDRECRELYLNKHSSSRFTLHHPAPLNIKKGEWRPDERACYPRRWSGILKGYHSEVAKDKTYSNTEKAGTCGACFGINIVVMQSTLSDGYSGTLGCCGEKR
jgi:hypothetical protein